MVSVSRHLCSLGGPAGPKNSRLICPNVATYNGMKGMQGACRRRKKEESINIEHIELIPHSYHRRPVSSPPTKSFEQQIYITMTRTAHRSAYLCKGVISCFVSRLVGISQFCAIYSFTGMLFMVSVLTMRVHCVRSFVSPHRIPTPIQTYIVVNETNKLTNAGICGVYDKISTIIYIGN